jgi:threonine dehydrogenase-like Zn-dependent dehydrogenase
LEVPPGLDEEDAVFFPGAETAVNLVQDAAPILGERVLILGQGVVGLLCASLLKEFPLESLVTADGFSHRREASKAIGVTEVLDPADVEFVPKAISCAGGRGDGYDVTIELTGNPAALDRAIELTAFSGRVIIGSWFGTKAAPLHLGGRYHRSRIRLISSQVSTIAPEVSGRWDKTRRYRAAWESLLRIRPGRWITHRFPIERAIDAYRLLDESPDQAMQVVFQYP